MLLVHYKQPENIQSNRLSIEYKNKFVNLVIVLKNCYEIICFEGKKIFIFIQIINY